MIRHESFMLAGAALLVAGVLLMPVGASGGARRAGAPMRAAGPRTIAVTPVRIAALAADARWLAWETAMSESKSSTA